MTLFDILNQVGFYELNKGLQYGIAMGGAVSFAAIFATVMSR